MPVLGPTHPSALPARRMALRSSTIVAGAAALAASVAAVLDADGYAALRADDGAVTLAAVRAEGYDLLVTDDMFPAIGGVSLIPYPRDYPVLALPIVLMTPSRPFPMPPNTALLPTPFTVDGLGALVVGLLARARDHYWS